MLAFPFCAVTLLLASFMAEPETSDDEKYASPSDSDDEHSFYSNESEQTVLSPTWRRRLDVTTFIASKGNTISSEGTDSSGKGKTISSTGKTIDSSGKGKTISDSSGKGKTTDSSGKGKGKTISSTGKTVSGKGKGKTISRISLPVFCPKANGKNTIIGKLLSSARAMPAEDQASRTPTPPGTTPPNAESLPRIRARASAHVRNAH